MTVIVNKHGEIIQTIYAPDDVVVLNTPENCVALPDPSNLNMYLDKGVWVDIPPPPSNGMVFDYIIKQWIDPRTLDEIKAQKWAEIKAERDQLEFGGFNYAGHIYDSDPTSQTRIMNAAAMGIAQEWTTKDNTVVSLSDVQIKELGEALVMCVAFVHELGRDARAKIDAAQTIEEVEAITL